MGLFKKDKGSKWDAAIGGQIRKAREEQGMTQAQLADAIYRSQGNISDYERGELSINAVDLVGIAQALKTSITFFYPDHVKPFKTTDLTDKESRLIEIFRDIQNEVLENLLVKQAKEYADAAIEAEVKPRREEARKALEDYRASKRKHKAA